MPQAYWAEDQADPSNKDDLIKKYLESKLGPQPEEDLQSLRNKQNLNVQMQRDAANANLMAGLNNASALISGGRYKADNSDLKASNKDRQEQIDASQKQMIGNQASAQKERQNAVNEYLSGKRENARLKQSAENNAATNRRIEEDAKAKLDYLKGAKEIEVGRRNDALSEKEDKDASARIDKLLDHITGSSRGPVGQEKQKLRGAVHALNIMKGMDTAEQLDKISPTMAHEIGSAMAASISPGHPAESIVKSLTPASSSADLAKALQYITGDTQHANLGSQLLLFKHMLERQAQVSKDIINQEYGPMVANVEDLKTHKKWGPRLKNVMEKGGLKFDENGQLTAFEPSYSNIATKEAEKSIVGGDGTAIAGDAKKMITKKQYSQKQNKTRVFYSDGTMEVVDGQQ